MSRLKVLLRIVLPPLGAYCALVLYTFPFRLMEAENLGEEICLLTGHGYPAAIFHRSLDRRVEPPSVAVIQDLSALAPDIGQQCALEVGPGVLLGTTYEVRIKGCCGTPGLSFKLWFDPVLTPLRASIRGSGYPADFVLFDYRRSDP